MAKILTNADEDGLINWCDTSYEDYDNEWSTSVIEVADLNNADAIIVFDADGDNTREISARRPAQPIIAVCDKSIIANQLALSRGVFPIFDKNLFDGEDGREVLKVAGITADKVVIVQEKNISLR